ncbi:hypothetical protein DM867_02060 [Halosegnis rubeus]|jgi:hypothetical protein|uniref:Uncharacterized protein n=1 Tax=Halosegnis rubeus TaxID=2212850 RepID=A0A5N5URC3_9EURY|nr:DUF5810 domain-containing protein [Halosegnis rubeus]KAB7515949.1 hypothetical protein DM867_02060 [Halosegnis rubeus]KAB7516838.1 hypothetical protein DMP03_05590 [Halosegnis rubeus]KAB7520035.1 hypothetical protein DP108_01945 [Halosegnis rubeus]
MGYACPVCDDPQVDARHLANHLAFTAILGDDGHEAWLDEHAPDWAEEGEAELAERVREFAEEDEYPQVFEDTTGGRSDRESGRSGELFESEGHDHSGHDHGHAHDQELPSQADVEMDEDTQAVLEEARELTKEMLAESEADEPDDEDEN